MLMIKNPVATQQRTQNQLDQLQALQKFPSTNCKFQTLTTPQQQVHFIFI